MFRFLRKERNISPENLEKIFCACLQQDNSACRLPAQKSFDLETFVKTACRKGVLSLIYKRLKNGAAAQDDALKNALRAMQPIYLAICAINAYCKEELLKILKLFWEKGLPVIPLKGVSLSWRLYGDISSRDQSTDIDLLVKEKDLAAARTILEECGYSFFPVDEIDAYKWYHLFNKPGHKPIELHWDITMAARSRPRIEGLWQGIQVVDWEGVKFHDFCPEELLLYLAAHLVNSDSFSQLRYVCDIRTLIRKYQEGINWRSLAQKARDWQLQGSLYAVLAAGEDFFNGQIPRQAYCGLSVSAPKRMFIRAFANRKIYFRQGFKRRLLDKYLSYIFFELSECCSLRGYLRIAGKAFFPPKEKMGTRSHISRAAKALIKL